MFVKARDFIEMSIKKELPSGWKIEHASEDNPFVVQLSGEQEPYEVPYQIKYINESENIEQFEHQIIPQESIWKLVLGDDGPASENMKELIENIKNRKYISKTESIHNQDVVTTQHIEEPNPEPMVEEDTIPEEMIQPSEVEKENPVQDQGIGTIQDPETVIDLGTKPEKESELEPQTGVINSIPSKSNKKKSFKQFLQNIFRRRK